MIVTLTTDFGLDDAYVGIMKGVVLSQMAGKPVQLVDLSHQIPAQDIRRAAFLLWSAIENFPPGTVHLAVVDPGVGSDRRAIVIKAGGQFFVGPDNGLFSAAIGRFPFFKVYHLNKEEHFSDSVSATFHGRDIFAPIAGKLAAGAEIASLGTELDPKNDEGLKFFELFDAEVEDERVVGKVLFADSFGNLVTNVPHSLLRWLSPEKSKIQIGHHRLEGWKRTFSDVESGEAVAYINSFGLLEVAVRKHSAVELMEISPYTLVQVSES